ncbi:MAG: hypothetical protein A2W25_11140 [candidate division Zixibacteria bacterium RBG_16_53_22]|nr:MAG: hypothetical protein A2W25_11140 [candidate division Zixibacteria bacterium RBG_16_53_22]
MSKKLVAGLIGWLILSLILMSSVWAAVNKDKAPATNDKSAQLSKSVIPTKTQLLQSRPRWVTWEKMNQDLDRAIRQELSGSAFEAAAGIIEESPFFAPSVATETAPENFDTAGNSWYDIGSNHRLGRIIAIVPASRNVGIDWANSENAALTTRNIFGALWIGASKTGGNFLGDVPTTLVGRGGFPCITYTVRGGKLALAYHHATGTPDGTWWAVEKVAGNFDWDDEFHVPDSIVGKTERAIWTTAAGGYIIDAADYDNDANATESLDVVHFFGNEGNLTGNSVDRYVYSRAVDSAGAWIYPGFTGTVAATVDTGIRISPTVVTSKKSRRVALIYTSERQCGFDDACSDVFYIESFNGGEDWAAAGYNFLSPPISNNRVNLTNFDSSDATRPTGDLMGVYDNNDSLVISWNQWVTFDFLAGVSAEADLYVWTKAFGPRKAVDGNFTVMADSAENAIIPDGRRQTLNYPHIGVHNGTGTPARTNFLYMTYVQFGGDSTTQYADTNEEAYLNGEVYVVCSTNNGKTWSSPRNMTVSRTPGCLKPVANVGTCSGTMFASCAEMVDDTIHVAYMTDEYAGSLVNSENTSLTASNNEIIYMKYPAFTPTPVQRISVTPGSFIQIPGSILTDTFYVQNIGNANLTVDSIENDSGWLVLTDTDTSGFTIIEGDPDQPITFTVNDATKPDGVYFDTVVVYNTSANKPVLSIEVIMIVDNGDAFVADSFRTLNNGTMLLSIGNTGNLGNGLDTAGMYQKLGTDTTSMLFDGTTFIVMRNATGDTVVGQYMHSQNGLHALLPLHVKEDSALGVAKAYTTSAGNTVTIPTGTYDYARAKFTSFLPDKLGVPYPGAWYGIVVEEEFWWFSAPTNALVMIQKISRENPPSWWPDVDKGTDGVTSYIGHGIDFDAVADTNPSSLGTTAANYGRQVPGYGLLWQQGIDPSSNYLVDSLVDRNGHFTALMNLGNGGTIDPPAMHITSNRYALYPGTGYVADTLYRMAADNSVDTADFWTADSIPGKQFKYFATDSSKHDSLPVDISSLMTMWILAGGDATVRTTAAAAFVIVDTSTQSGNSGCFKMTSNYQKIRNLLGLDSVATKLVHTAVQCSTAACIAKPGDANASNTYTLGDIIATVNYIFSKPGCTPVPLCWLSGLLCRGDWNGSGTVTLGDAIQGVNYIFTKPGGPWFPVPSGLCCTPYTP